MDGRAGVRSPLRRGAIAFIETYRSDVSDRIGARCRFETSCSEFGLTAFRDHSFPVATAMTVGRLARCHAPVSGRRVARMVASLGVVLASVLALPMLMGSALAQVSGPCTATLNGVDAASAAKPENAIEVQYDAQVPAGATMSAGPVVYKVQLEFAGARWTVKTGSSSTNTWTSTIDVKKYAKYGVGLYKVHAVSTSPGGTCKLDAYVKVVGKGALSTPVGIAGGAAMVGGLALTGAATAKAAKPPKGKKPASAQADYDVAPAAAPPEAGDVGLQMKIEGHDAFERTVYPARSKGSSDTPRCSLMSIAAFFMTTAVLLGRDGRR